MVKIKDLEKCKHPNSRKTKALSKKIKKATTREKSKLAGSIKLNLLGEKVLWFQNNIEVDLNVYSPQKVKEVIEKYLSRFEEELKQIRIKHSIGQRKNRQHANREDIIKMTTEREREEFNTCGIEIPDLLNTAQLKMLRQWNGELRFLSNFKLKRYNKTFFTKIQEKSTKPVEISKKSEDKMDLDN